MSIGVENCGDHCHRGSTEEIFDIVGVTLLVLEIQVELLQVRGPLIMVVIL
jgi:hypothetical protein